MTEDLARRVRLLEEQRISTDARLQAVSEAIQAMRRERELDSRQVVTRLENLKVELEQIHRELSVWHGARRAIIWVAGLATTAVAAAIAVWSAIRGGWS